MLLSRDSGASAFCGPHDFRESGLHGDQGSKKERKPLGWGRCPRWRCSWFLWTYLSAPIWIFFGFDFFFPSIVWPVSIEAPTDVLEFRKSPGRSVGINWYLSPIGDNRQVTCSGGGHTASRAGK